MTAILDRLALLLPIFYPGTAASAKAPNSVNASVGNGAWIILPGPGEEDLSLEGEAAAFTDDRHSAYFEVRTYHLIYFAGALGVGGPGDLIGRCGPVVDPEAGWHYFFRGRPMLSDPANFLGDVLGIHHIHTSQDSGVTSVDWAGTAYVGVNCPLEITSLVVYPIVAGQ